MTATENVADVLTMYGEQFTGGDAAGAAAGWIDAGISDPEEVGGWCLAGVWDEATAARLRASGIMPQRLMAIAAKMTDGLDAAARADRWTDGCPIYSVCNGDTDVSEIIEAAK